MNKSKDTDWQIRLKKPKPIGVLCPENPSHMQGYTEAQNKGMEKNLPNGKQKKQGLQS